MKETIAVDVDDVLVAEAAFVVAYSNKHWGHSLTLEDYRESWQDMWGVDDTELRRRSEVLHQPGLQGQYAPITGAYEALLLLKKHYNLVAITSRQNIIKDETIRMVHGNFPGVFSEVYFTGFWDGHNPAGRNRTKGDLVREIGAAYLIDDQPKHCFTAASHGIKTILFGDYAISRGLSLPEHVVRCKDWAAVTEYFDDKRR